MHAGAYALCLSVFYPFRSSYIYNLQPSRLPVTSQWFLTDESDDADGTPEVDACQDTPERFGEMAKQ